MLAQLTEDRLFRELRDRRGLAYAVDAGVTDDRTAAIFSVHTQVRPEHVPEVVAFFRRELARLAQAPVTNAELERARWDVARTFDDGFESNAGIGDRLEAVVARDAGAAHWSRFGESLAALAPADLQQIAAGLSTGGEAITVIGNLASVEEKLKADGLEVETLKAIR